MELKFITDWLDAIKNALQGNVVLGLVLAFAAGFLTFFTPCGLASAPIIVGYTGGTGATKKKALVYSLFMVLGASVVFMAIGAGASFISDLLSNAGIVTTIFYMLLGLLMVALALDFLGIVSIIPRIQALFGKKPSR